VLRGKTAGTALKRTRPTNYVGIAALILAIIGIVVPTVLWAISREHRELVYAVNPIRTTIVSAEQCSPELRVSYRGEDLGCVDITGAHVAIWNNGNVSIRQDNVRKDVVIFTDPEVQILDAKLRGLNGKETEFAITYDEESWKHGRIKVSWQILEKNEGDSIQITYLGLPSINIYVDGKIEGFGMVKRIDLGLVPKEGSSWTELFESQKRSQQTWLYMAISTFVITLLILVAVWWGFLNLRGWQRKVSIIVPLCWLWLWVGLLFFSTPKFVHWPPFGF
jgi:hypothetical protein